mmetsp:Transcript_20593/g.47580  ORF Transcript_20593/g.47580 Transcript_20593/m.47580 type:complete len:224 (+) Transcript_20593:370-1041(+)
MVCNLSCVLKRLCLLCPSGILSLIETTPGPSFSGSGGSAASFSCSTRFFSSSCDKSNAFSSASCSSFSRLRRSFSSSCCSDCSNSTSCATRRESEYAEWGALSLLCRLTLEESSSAHIGGGTAVLSCREAAMAASSAASSFSRLIRDRLSAPPGPSTAWYWAWDIPMATCVGIALPILPHVWESRKRVRRSTMSSGVVYPSMRSSNAPVIGSIMSTTGRSCEA